jgi:hypothetical protein
MIEGKLYPAAWEDRFVINMPDGFNYDKMAQILSDNADKILADTSYGVPTCGSMPPSPEDVNQLAPSRIHLLFHFANIGAVYEIQEPAGTSYVVTITCRGTHPSEVLPKAINLYFSWDLKNFVEQHPKNFIDVNPDTYASSYIQYLLASRSTTEIEHLEVAIMGGHTFPIPGRSDTDAIAIAAYEGEDNALTDPCINS